MMKQYLFFSRGFARFLFLVQFAAFTKFNYQRVFFKQVKKFLQYYVFVTFLPYPNTIFHKMTSNKKLLKHIRTTNALSSIPPVLDILDRNDTSKLIVKYTYEIPVVLLRISDLGSAQGIIVFTDFSEIKTNTCMKYGRVPYSIAKEDYSVGGVIIPKDRLFNSSIRRDQYDTLAKMIERSVQGTRKTMGFL